MPPLRVEAILKNIYYDASHPGGYGSAEDLWAAAKRKRRKITLGQVRHWLQAQDAYTLHRRIVRRFPRRKFISKGKDHIWQADLVDMQAIQKENAGNRYLLTVIDIFSRRAHAKPIKTKKASDVINAFKKILKEAKVTPSFLHVDRGSEFINAKFRAFLEQKSIKMYHTNNEVKCALLERWHRTLKNKMFKYFTAKNTLHYLRVLPEIISAYNNRVHKSLGVAPSSVNSKNEKKLWEKQYSAYLELENKRFKFKINDTVRITVLKRAFERGYQRRWKKEKFKIVDRFGTIPPTYKLVDLNGEVVEGKFYEQELGKVSEP